jgi:hypothetical protein
MTVIAVTSASVGTKLATVADTRITGITMPLPTSMADATPLVLIDAAAAPSGAVPVPATLYAAGLGNLLGMITAVKPGVPLTPGMTAPVSPFSLGAMATHFSNGVFVQSCPTGATFNVTTGP